MGVPQLERGPRKNPGVHSPPHPPWQLQPQGHTAPCCQPGVGKAAKTLTQSAPMQGGNPGPGESDLAPAPSVQTESQAPGTGARHGARGIRAAFTGSFSPGTVLATSVWHRKASAETGGLRPGLAVLRNGPMAEATQSSSNPSIRCGLALDK